MTTAPAISKCSKHGPVVSQQWYLGFPMAQQSVEWMDGFVGQEDVTIVAQL